MRAIEATVRVTPEGHLTADVPDAIPAGEYRMLLVIKELPAVAEPLPVEYLTIEGAPWSEDLSLRREDMYDDWGR